MGRPFGKIERPHGRASRKKKSNRETFKIRLRGADDAPLRMSDLQQGLLEVIGMLKSHDALRAKHVTIYTKLIDGNGKPILPDASGQWEIIPYRSAADELGA